ncbi:unnamed protein product [Adineta steineri]|uniref:Uncharacterized protein n=1 Tax=Adineta steineri TaxID=433720 RepID=A0A816G9R5_9BILA|nr:unnamed protein product [Adineta steineri]CAF1672217.1 unnamed protein product [Adineta steineri]
MRMINVCDESKLYIWLKDLTVYNSNFAELRDSKNAGSKIKYRILQLAKDDVIVIMDKQQQKIDVRISDFIVSIAPAAVKTLIGITSSLGTLQTNVEEQKEKVNSKSFKDATFWCINGFCY